MVKTTPLPSRAQGRRSAIVTGVLTAFAVVLGACQEPRQETAVESQTRTQTQTESEAPSPATHATHATRLLWGDLHVHSNLSFDAYSFGNRTLTPADTLAFARGETLTASSGQEARLARPLDFLLVSDHAEYMGVMRELHNDNAALLQSEIARRWRDMLARNNLQGVINEFVGSIQEPEAFASAIPPPFSRSIWQEVNAAAEEYNAPGEFTALIGYEWTSMIDGRNLHRNVLFRDGPEKTLQHVPFPSISGRNPEQLWAALQDYVDSTDGQVMAIPHNGNLSDGLMFAEAQGNGEPITAAYARLRARWEPVYEMTQVKGDAESHPVLSPQDAFADFENWDETNIAMQPRSPEDMKRTLAGEYARPVLKTGLKIGRAVGSNPFKFGMIGSTDAHTSLATADSDNFFGKFPDSEPSVERLSNRMGGALWPNRHLAASGYAAVWARDNTRAGIFDALNRKEVYATTGPRIAVRFFGGWNLPGDLHSAADAVERSYALAVPMGGDLSEPPAGAGGPDFVIIAGKDPLGAGLDRVQVIKGWLDSNGRPQEKIYDVAWSGERTLEPDSGVLPSLDSTVDAAQASYDKDSGAASLSTVWRDPDFDPRQPAFYYLRVIEVSTPRWTTYDAVRFGAELPDDVPAALQERAYTSPIWYSPAG